MGTIFINYRREETSGEARALFKDLVARLGETAVFMDVDNIELGRDFRKEIRERLASCDLLLALIGRNWVNAQNPSGRRRLEDPGDFVRLEIEAALKRNIPVTPVLVQGAKMPTAEELPEDIRDFAYRHGFELRHDRWESDLQEMLKRLRLGAQKPAARKPWLATVGASVAVLVIAGAGLVYYGKVTEEGAKSPPAETRGEKSAAPAGKDRVLAQKERAETGGAAKAAEERKAAGGAGTLSATTGVKIENAVCTDLGSARYRLELSGWADGEAGSLVWAGPNVPPKTGAIDEAKFTCPGWGAAQPEDGAILYKRACKRAPGDVRKTQWLSRTTFQWHLDNAPSQAFAALRGPHATGAPDSVITEDKLTFSCSKS